ncbi:MAG: hypothetical protein ACRDRP_25020 [Pseudonocardiaceae bacterium]
MIDVTKTQYSQRERCDEQHPAWCSPGHCLVTEDGVRVHEQAPVRWEDHEAEVRLESRLLDPAGEEDTYVELILTNLRLTWFRYCGILPVEVVRRLCDQLTEHLDAVALPGEPPGPRPALPGVLARWGRPVSEEPEGGIHLLLADDTVSAGHRGRCCLTLCGELVALVSASCLPGCDREHVLCQECVSEANVWGAAADRQAAR